MVEQNDIEAIRDFIKTVKRTYEAGGATEHTYRPALTLLCDTVSDGGTKAVNEHKRTAHGSPDITMIHNNIAIGYLEAKDIGIDIRKFKDANKNQFERYSQNLDNLIYTNCLDWDFYRDGKLIGNISIAKLKNSAITPNPLAYITLANLLQSFLGRRPKTITEGKELIEHTAKKTLIMRHAFEKGLSADEPVKSLVKSYNTVVKELIKGLDEEEFADMYAQTITYGLFAAWFDNKKLTKFNRQQIEDLLPEDYPFLKNLFKFIIAMKPDPTVEWAIKDLIAVYNAADLEQIKKTYGQDSGRADLFMHFYENFLQAYDAKKRKAHGVYFTPEPVVDFIVRGVDWVLKNEFNLHDGLANSEKIGVEWKTDNAGNFKDKDVHKVQILDPATGTGTFLAQTIRHIEKEVKASSDNWSSYVDKDLLPRLNGFEMLIAPYTMCYMKLDRVLKESKYVATDDRPERMHIYLTDSLTEANNDITVQSFNNEWIEKEAQGATDIKDNQPIMCVIGNPPYLSESKNKDPWILNLMEDYKKEPNTTKSIEEENPKSINDDYAKFIRMAQYMVDKNGEGVVGMITNHGYLDNPTFRGMRWHLMNSFDRIYILDLHGDVVKNKTAPDGKTDKNVFDIKKGVSIIIAWKKEREEGKDKPIAQVFRGDIRGTYKTKEKFLLKTNLNSNKFKKLDVRAPDYFFKRVNYKLKPEYNKGFKINDFMKKKANGIKTHRDHLVFDMDKKTLINRIKTFYDKTNTDEEIQDILNLKDNDEWSVTKARELGTFDTSYIIPCEFRPFDTRLLYYDSNLIDRDRHDIMRHFLKEGNVGLLVKRQCKQDFSYAFVTDKITESCVFESAYANNTVFPLYTYPEMTDRDGQEKTPLKTTRIVNMDETIRKAIEDVATDSKHGKPDEYAIFDYIYGILHAPEYRTRYNEFLKEAFPRIPYPKDSAEFWHLSSVGTKLRDLHLVNTKKIKFDPKAYQFKSIKKGVGKNIVKTGGNFLRWQNDKIWINDTQYFDNVPESVWDFYIGGNRPARKWLKDRKGQTLEHKDILHYQRIIAVLVQTKTTMDDIKWSRP